VGGKEGRSSLADAIAGVAQDILFSYIRVLHNVMIRSFILYCAVRHIAASGCASTSLLSRLTSMPCVCASEDSTMGGS
jgi:hypothetical protein